MMLQPLKIAERANELYSGLKKQQGFTIPYVDTPPEQILAICVALCEAINKELQELP